MLNETRNELLNLYSYIKKKDIIYLEMLLDNFKSELEHNKQELEYQLKQINQNIELLQDIKEDIIKKGSGENER